MSTRNEKTFRVAFAVLSLSIQAVLVLAFWSATIGPKFTKSRVRWNFFLHLSSDFRESWAAHQSEVRHRLGFEFACSLVMGTGLSKRSLTLQPRELQRHL